MEIMWVAYRDYSDRNLLLEKSPWSNDPDVLRNFVSGIVCGGGGDAPEAVEHALHEVNKEHAANKVTRVLLIADAPPHEERKGEYLAHHECTMQTDYKLEANVLAANNIPVFTFHLNNEPQLVASFKHIANVTNGTATLLDSADKLIDVICLNALEDMGGAELVAEYNAKYA